jgi:hypothetical protein
VERRKRKTRHLKPQLQVKTQLPPLLSVDQHGILMGKVNMTDVMTNDDVITLNNAKVSKSIITEKIRRGKNNFNTSVEGLIALRSAKVSDALIKEMMSAPKK